MADLRVRFFNIVQPVTTFFEDLTSRWEKVGWQIQIVTSNATYGEGRNRRLDAAQAEIKTLPSFGISYQGKIRKLIVLLVYSMTAPILTLFGRQAFRNIFLTQPPLFYCWGRALKFFRGQPYYVVVMDLYPQVAVATGILSQEAFLTRVLGRLSAWGLRKADGVIVIGRAMRQKVLAMGVDDDKVHLIPNWVDEEKICPVPREQNGLRKKMGLEDKFIVLYSGNMGASHYFDDLISAASDLRENHEIHILFIGGGYQLQSIREDVAERELRNISFLPFQPQERLSHSLSLGDVHFVSLREEFTGLVVPSKVYGIFAVGRPIIFQGSPEGEIFQIIDKENVGMNVPPGNPRALSEAILYYYHHPAVAREQGKRARILAETKYARENALSAYTEVIS